MVKLPYVPQAVKDDIRKHLEESIQKAVENFPSVFEEEDTVTGYLFGLMDCKNRKILVENQDADGVWEWGITSNKFGGRGKKSTESIIGADGIIELHLLRYGTKYTKSLLFQSKIDWTSKDEKLYQQCGKMLPWAGAAAVFNYTETDFEGYTLEQTMGCTGAKPKGEKRLGKLLGGDFLDCHIGDSDLKYDARMKKLIWLDQNNKYVATKFTLNRRLKINVKSPIHPSDVIKIDQEIQHEEIYKHLLKNENIGGHIRNAENNGELKKIQNSLSKTFHPDKHTTLPQGQQDSLSELMKQLNDLIDKQKERLKRRK